MTYCRFENTYNDLRDCLGALSEIEIDDLVETEKEYAKKLILLCKEIADFMPNNFRKDTW